VPLEMLTEAEQRTLDAYVALLRKRLVEELLGIWIFGSVARGESWPPGMPIRSDLDLLVVVARPLDGDLEQELVDSTYPLFLETGRQIGPQFRTREQLGRTPEFVENLRRDAIEIWRHPLRPVTL
jgi:predicted nucleotidyltransferase